MKLRIGTRGSNLALWQTHLVIKKLKEKIPNFEYEIVIIKTIADRNLTLSILEIEDKGLFIKEFEEALLRNDIDCAVHSCKDMPTDLPDGLEIHAFLERGNPEEILISRDKIKLNELPKNANIATSSIRRTCQLKAVSADFTIHPIRGNIETRLKTFYKSGWDAMVLAAAGLERLSLHQHISDYISIDIMLPAVAQAVICVESRIDDYKTNDLLKLINHNETNFIARAERAFLNFFHAGCKTPISANAIFKNNKLFFKGYVAHPKTFKSIKYDSIFSLDNKPEIIGRSFAEEMMAIGADKIINE